MGSAGGEEWSRRQKCEQISQDDSHATLRLAEDHDAANKREVIAPSTAILQLQILPAKSLELACSTPAGVGTIIFLFLGHLYVRPQLFVQCPLQILKLQYLPFRFPQLDCLHCNGMLSSLMSQL